MTSEVIKLLQKYIPHSEKWVTRYSSSGARLNLFKQELESNGIIFRNLRFVLHGNMGVSTSYEEFVWAHAKSKDDYKKYIPKKSLGLTKLGLELFQLSLQSYVYSVLGAQAKTRWGIVEEGGKSLQTQEVFKNLMEDTIVLDDITTSISNMRQAIKSTNVILNYAISPGLILIPSDLMILKNPVPGYNNVFSLATKDMLFGNNSKLNLLTKTLVEKKRILVDIPDPVSVYKPSVGKHVSIIKSKGSSYSSTASRGANMILPAAFSISLVGMYLIRAFIF